MSFPPLAFNRLAYFPMKRISLSVATAKGCCAEIPVVDCSKFYLLISGLADLPFCTEAFLHLVFGDILTGEPYRVYNIYALFRRHCDK
jgi:hypothetical protein